MRVKSKKAYRVRRHKRLRRTLHGTSERPRMALFKSNRYLSVQFVDDVNQVTLTSVSSRGIDAHRNIAAAQSLGRRAAEVAMEKGIRQVVVDRGGFRFHGRIKAVVDSAVESGLQITSKPVAAQPAADAEPDEKEKS